MRRPFIMLLAALLLLPGCGQATAVAAPTPPPILVNPWHAVPVGYTPELVQVGDGRLEKQAAAAFCAMQKAAAQDGITLTLVSGYRSHARQQSNFARRVALFEARGYSRAESVDRAAQVIAVPGTSEHELGLAADICSLEESFEETEAFAWLQTHCQNYGFILRYPKGKQAITGIVYEPWHYRYVGACAPQLGEQTLEEYLGQTEQGQRVAWQES